MAETRYDLLADEFDSLRLEVSNLRDWAQGVYDRVPRADKILWSAAIMKCDTILERFKQKNIPPVRKGS